MSATWKTVRVFISSTFRDMHAERDQLVRFIFPRLREELLKRRIHLIDVDLRWGVTTEQDALAVCREVIDECRPRFLCILGGRYGWTPPGQPRSITADEIHYSALDKANAQGYHYFYFRDPTATVAMAEDTSGEFREPAGSDKEFKLQELKQAVADAGFEPRIYSAVWSDAQQRLIELEEFGHRVYDDLLSSIDDEFGIEAAEQLDEFTEERSQMDAFMQERTERYVVGSRRAVLDELEAFAVSDGEPNVFVLSGTPGSGKSALLAKFCNDYVDSGGLSDSAIVLPHFIGASTGSTDLRRSLRRLCYELQSAISAADPAAKFEPVPEDVKELNQQFPLLLEQAAGLRRVVLIIDALNQMDGTDNAHAMNWLPWQLPPNVRVIVSSLEHSALDALRKRGDRIREQALAPLGEADARAIIEGVLDRYRKRMSDEQITLLLSKTEADTPLYLLVALEELRTLGDYDEITHRIRELHGTTTELFLWILKDRLEQDPGFRDAEGNAIGAELVRTFVSCLGVSRHGLSHTELASLIAPGDPEDDALGNVAALERLLRPYLMRRGELLNFFHGQLIEAVEAEYLDEEHERDAAHRELAGYFYNQLNPYDAEPWSGDSTRALSELPYHQTASEAWDDLEATLCDLRFIQAKCVAGLTYELVRDYTVALNAHPELGEERRKELQRKERLGQYEADLIKYARRSRISISSANRHGAFGLRNSLRRLYRAKSIFPNQITKANPAPLPPDTRELRKSICWAKDISANQSNVGKNNIGFVPIRTFANFVSSHSHLLDVFPYETVPIAYNHASDGLVADQSKDLVNTLTTAWLRRAPRAPAPRLFPLCLRTLSGHTAKVSAIGLKSDGNTAVSVSEDKTLRVWDVHTGECLHLLRGHCGTDFTSITLTPDGHTAISIGYHETLYVWNITSGEMLRTLEGHTDVVRAVAITPDGKRAVSASADKTLRVWNVISGEMLRRLKLKTDRVNAVGLSSNGNTVVTASGDTLEVWDIAAGNVLKTLKVHYAEPSRRMVTPLTAVALTPNGRVVVTVSQDTLFVVDIDQGEILRELSSFTGQSGDVAITPDGSMVVMARDDKCLHVWNIANGELLRVITVRNSGVTNSVAISSDGERAVSLIDDMTPCVWDVVRGEDERMLEGHSSGVFEVALTPDGDTAISASSSGNLRVWDVSSGECVRMLTRNNFVNSYSPVVVTPDGCQVISSFAAGKLGVWDINCAECPQILEHTHGVIDLVVTPDGTRVVSSSRDSLLRVWDISNGELLKTLKGHTKQVNSVTLTPDGNTAVSASFDGTLRVWDVSSGKCVRILTVPQTQLRRSLTSVSLTPDGNWAISWGWDRLIQVWDITNGELLRTLEGHPRSINNDVAFTPDGMRAVVGSNDSTLCLWDIHRGEAIRTFEGHTRSVTTVAFTPSASMVISSGLDNIVRVWDTNNGELITVYPLESSVTSIVVVSDKQFIAGTKIGQLHFLTLQNYP